VNVKQVPGWVLIVEDEILLAVLVEEALATFGFADVRVACSVDAGRSFIANAKPALAILDVNLRGALVFPLAEELQAMGVPIVFSSSSALHDLPRQWREHPFVPKPLTAEGLAAALVTLNLFARSDRVAAGSAREGS
jgi:DNA-binding response OmpR family regulator